MIVAQQPHQPVMESRIKVRTTMAEGLQIKRSPRGIELLRGRMFHRIATRQQGNQGGTDGKQIALDRSVAASQTFRSTEAKRLVRLIVTARREPPVLKLKLHATARMVRDDHVARLHIAMMQTEFLPGLKRHHQLRCHGARIRKHELPHPHKLPAGEPRGELMHNGEIVIVLVNVQQSGHLRMLQVQHAGQCELKHAAIHGAAHMLAAKQCLDADGAAVCDAATTVNLAGRADGDLIFRRVGIE